jgi:hypothetical protein
MHQKQGYYELFNSRFCRFYTRDMGGVGGVWSCNRQFASLEDKNKHLLRNSTTQDENKNTVQCIEFSSQPLHKNNNILIQNHAENKPPRPDFKTQFQNKLNSSLERLNSKLKKVSL